MMHRIYIHPCYGNERRAARSSSTDFDPISPHLQSMSQLLCHFYSCNLNKYITLQINDNISMCSFEQINDRMNLLKYNYDGK